MPRPNDPKTLACDFARSYELGRSPVVRELERSVLGCDYGGTSWTTRHEAVRVAEMLELRPQKQLLDLGAGSGWPGLYLAQATGCDVVLVDVPLAGLRVAMDRAAMDGLHAQCRGVTADGAKLPFRNAAFDAISHSDVLCCMPAKLSLLRECRRVARDGARMVFSVIAVTPDLSDAERRIALDGGPVFVEAPNDYAVLLDQSGWQMLERIDLTAEFARCVRALVEGTKARADALTAALGREEFAERLERRQTTLTATDRGLLRREIFVATTSGSTM
jgi:ubiquinone/menaquinone biosynthesis C-methylase UbiE